MGTTNGQYGTGNFKYGKMNDGKVLLIMITFESNKILIQRSVTSKKDDVLEKNTIKLELSVARIFHKVLNKGRLVEIFEKTDYELLGSMLYKILVRHEEVKTFFLNILAEVIRDKESRCRVLLEFKENIYELAALPWEYLLVPRDEDKQIPSFFLAADHNKQFDLIRYINIENKPFKPFDPSERNEVNVVLVVVNALNKPVEKLKLTDVFKRLTAKFKKETGADGLVYSKFNSYVLENPGKDNLYEQLAEITQNIQGPYVLHFYGHAEMQEDGPNIGLIGADENIDWVKGKYFIDLFDQQVNALPLPVLTILQACESGQVDENGQGLGIGLVKKGVPVVVAMQNEVTQEVSLAFIERLYNLIMEGEDIGHAVTQGRHFLGCEYGKDQNFIEEHYNTNTFGTPVIYTSVEEVIRLMPKVEKEKVSSVKKNKRCQKCGWRYANTQLEQCNRNFCGGKLIEEEKFATAPSAGSRPQTSSMNQQAAGFNGI